MNSPEQAVAPRPATPDDLDGLNHVISQCVAGRPVSDRIKKLTLPSLLFEAADFSFMDLSVAGQPIAGVLALQDIDEGLLLHSLYVDPTMAGRGIGASLIDHARTTAVLSDIPDLIVKAFPEAVSYFERAGFRRSDILDYPHTLVMRSITSS